MLHHYPYYVPNISKLTWAHSKAVVGCNFKKLLFMLQTNIPTDENLGLSFIELTVIELHDKQSQILNEDERTSLSKKLESIWTSQMKLAVEMRSYSSNVCK